MDKESINFPHTTQLKDATVGLHELYLSLQEGGFKKGEALSLIARMIMLNTQPTEE